MSPTLTPTFPSVASAPVTHSGAMLVTPSFALIAAAAPRFQFGREAIIAGQDCYFTKTGIMRQQRGEVLRMEMEKKKKRKKKREGGYIVRAGDGGVGLVVVQMRVPEWTMSGCRGGGRVSCCVFAHKGQR